MKIALAEGLPGRLAIGAGAATALLALALVVGAVLVISRGVPDAVPPAPDSLVAFRLQMPAESGELTGALVERPLFWSSRRPVEAEETVVEEPRQRGPDPFDKATLAGIFVSGPDSGVILRLGGERNRVLVGDDMAGWQLVSLTPDSATFVRLQGGEERVLKLEHALVAAPIREPSGDAGTEADSQRNPDE
ncbi:MAG: hypothetical protein M0R02_16435 [Bacteroidales bacterium]|nr:hypothetical protein [Bacteroidales bacterium]